MNNELIDIIAENVEQVINVARETDIQGTFNYNELQNKPSINNITLQGNLTKEQLGITSYDDTLIKQQISSLQTTKADKTQIPTKTSQLTNDSGYINNTYHDTSKQDKLTAGTNITIENNVISSTGGGSGTGVWDGIVGDYIRLEEEPDIAVVHATDSANVSSYQTYMYNFNITDEATCDGNAMLNASYNQDTKELTVSLQNISEETFFFYCIFAITKWWSFNQFYEVGYNIEPNETQTYTFTIPDDMAETFILDDENAIVIRTAEEVL